MDYLVTLFYGLFCACVVYPPVEFASAGFTIAHLFESFLGSENTNFFLYHIRRTAVTVLVHAALPFGYVLTLWCAGWDSEWVPSSFYGTFIIFMLMLMRVCCWWDNHKMGHPVVKTLLPYVAEGMDWKQLADTLNTEFMSVDKVSIPLTSTSKLIVMSNYLMKVTQYTVHIVKQSECTLVATGADQHSISLSGEEEVQFLNIEVISSRNNIKPLKFRVTTSTFRDDLQPRLLHPVRLPGHLTLLPTLIERFITVFKTYVDQNPVYYYDEEPEQCIGCMNAPADVKLERHCHSPPPHFIGGPQECETCDCRVLWCYKCMARWWAARATGAPSEWLAGRCTCPVCRARFCVLDVCPAALRSP